MTTTISYTKPAAYWLWFVFKLYKEKQYCYACGLTVKPKNCGAFKALDDLTIGVWHDRLPCLLALQNITHITENAPRNY